jgi:hypothetical protein
MSETLLMAVRGDDAEPVVIDTADDDVTLILDDGARITFDRRELVAALDHEEAA